ncbi:FAD:protein FMN transferase [Rhodococcus sp. OK302]|uniref:FAD:protein FMN transferase n=1 Tax=Rhodococcus sp. OK302 TaxID=1882769 RepID=UPI000B93E07E|nr:FAD:protein FMN transferase [Rhodococcus sp. OK302]OYD67634.1 thiamine biosynthesis lipoprotein [Rhodococcus sp. OK302]
MIHADNRITRAWVEQIMGMPISLHVRADDPSRPDITQAVASTFERLRLTDSVLSTWRPDSDVMRWRRGDLALEDAHHSLREVMALCEQASSETNRLFTTDLIGPDGTRGWDPTGLAKGWAIEAAVERLRSVDGIAFAVNAGGDITCGHGGEAVGCPRPWRIGIENPIDRSVVSHVVSIIDGAVATSGTAARGNHIVDPRSGKPAGCVGSITVGGPSLLWADIWATAAFIDPTVLNERAEWADYRVLFEQRI